MAAELVAHRPRMLDRDAEGDPSAAVAAERDDLGDRGAGGVAAEAVQHLALDELAHAAVQAGGVERRRRALGDERRQVAALDQHADGDVIGDAVEERVRAAVEQSAVEPVRRGGEADDLQARVGGTKPVEEPTVLGVARPGHQVRLVDDGEIDVPEVPGASRHRLHPGDEDLPPELALAEPGGIDARRGIRPEPDQRCMVLRDQLADMGDDQDAGLGVGHHRAAGELGEDHALAGAGRCDHQRRAAPGAEPGIERLDRRALVVAELDHARAHGSAGAGSSAARMAPTGLAGPSPFTPFAQTGTVESDRARSAGSMPCWSAIEITMQASSMKAAIVEPVFWPSAKTSRGSSGVVVADADGERLAGEGDVADEVTPAVRQPRPGHVSPSCFQVRCAT